MQKLVVTVAAAVALGACGDGSRPEDGGPPIQDGGTLEDARAADGGVDGGRPFEGRFDVIVAGAGTGGIAAAIQAARMGASVLLVEETDWVGGQMTAAAVTSMDGGKVDPAGTGIHRELEARVRAHYADPERFPPDGKSIATCYFGDAQVCFEPRVGREILLELLAENSVELRLRTRVTGVVRDADTVVGAVLSDGTRLASHVLIDATEAGDVIPLTGARYRVGASLSDEVESTDCIQSLTYLAVIRRYPDGVPPELRIDEPPPGYDDAARQAFRSGVTLEGVDGRRFPWSLAEHNRYRGMPNSLDPVDYSNAEPELISRTGVNFVNDYPGLTLEYVGEELVGRWHGVLPVTYLEDREERRRLDCRAKLWTLSFVYYLQTELDPSWSVADDEGYDSPYNVEDNACPDMPAALRPLERHLPVMPYLRESRRIVALHTLVADEIVRAGTPAIATRGFTTSLAVGDYPNDLHNCNADDELEADLGETRDDISGRGFFEIPFESFIPERVDGFLPAEKNIGQSRLVNGATRLQPSTMATGQAAGAIAALAVAAGIQPRQVPPLAVQLRLAGDRVALSRMPYGDVPVDHPRWTDVQIVAARGIMIGVPERFGVDEDLSRAQAAVVLAALLGLDVDAPPSDPTFVDVGPGHFAYGAIEAIAAAGLTAGCGGDAYCPDGAVTRGQLAAFLRAGYELPDGTLGTFDDVEGPFEAAAEATAGAGLMEPCAPRSFCPGRVVTRGLMATVAVRALRREL